MTRDDDQHRWFDATKEDIAAELERIGLGDWGVRVGEKWAEVSSPDDVTDPDDVARIVDYFAPEWHTLEAVYSPKPESDEPRAWRKDEYPD